MNRIVRQIAAVLLSMTGCGGRQPVETNPPRAETAAAPMVTQAPSGVQTILLMSLADYQVPITGECHR